jgi:hypothetical protein
MQGKKFLAVILVVVLRERIGCSQYHLAVARGCAAEMGHPSDEEATGELER